MGHTMEECVTLRDKNEELIWVEQFKNYVKNARFERRPLQRRIYRREYWEHPRYGGAD